MIEPQNTVLFFSYRNQYLEHDLFCSIAKRIPKNVRTIYIYSDYEDIQTKGNLLIKRKYFDEVIELPCPVFKQSLRSIKGVILWLKYIGKLKRWKSRLLESIDRESPLSVVLLSVNMVNSMLIFRYRSNLYKIFLQSSNTRKTYPNINDRRAKFKRFFYQQIIGIPRKSNHVDPRTVSDIDKYLMWSKKWMAGADVVNGPSIEFTGFPLNDDHYKFFISGAVIPKSAKVLIVLNKESAMGINNWITYKDFYLKMIESFPDFHFEIKPHPLSSPELIAKSFPNHNIVESINWDEPHLVINHWSSVTNNSIIRGVPTILVNPGGKFNFEERHLDHYEAIATTHEEFTELVRQFSAGPEHFKAYRENFLQESFSGIEGNSTERVVDAILTSSLERS